MWDRPVDIETNTRPTIIRDISLPNVLEGDNRHHFTAENSSSDDDENNEESNSNFSHAIVSPLELEQDELRPTSEAYKFGKTALPNALVTLFVFAQWTASLTIASKYLGIEDMSGLTLASLFASLTALIFLFGMLTAVETLAPQAFGAGNYEHVGILCQRGVLIFYSMLPITFIIWWNAEVILLASGQPEHESRLAGVFLRWHFFTLPGLALWEGGRRFMWSQDSVSQIPFVMITLVALGFHIVMLHVLIPNCGFIGTPIAHASTTWFMVLLLLLWMYVFKPHHPGTLALPPRPWVILNPTDMRAFFRLGIPGVLSMSEWLYFELFTFFAGLLGEIPLAVTALSYSLIPLMFVVPLGLSVGLSSRVGNLLAKGKVNAARLLIKRVLLLAVLLAVATSLLVFLLRDWIISQYTDDAAVQAAARDIWPLLSGFLFIDAIFGCQSGIMRACSLQARFSLIVFLSLFVVGLPLLGLLGFQWGFGLGLKGLWIAFPLPYFLLNIGLYYTHSRFDFEKYSQDVIAREARMKIASE